jgi:hypothetical protein
LPFDARNAVGGCLLSLLNACSGGASPQLSALAPVPVPTPGRTAPPPPSQTPPSAIATPTPAAPAIVTTPVPSASPSPAAIATLHTANWSYFGLAGEPAGLTAAWLASHATFVQADPQHAAAAKSAGAPFAVAYTDPMRVVVANHEPLWDAPEADWYHSASHKRIHANFAGLVQNALNVAQPDVVARYAALTRSIAASAPYDFVEADDVHWDLTGEFFGFNAAGTEAQTTTDAGFDGAVDALLDASAIPVLVSGYSTTDGHLNDVSGNTAFLGHSAGGINNEGCLVSTQPKDQTHWAFDENTLLAMTNAGKYAVCWGRSPVAGDARAQRLMFVASWWLTYDPHYSVAFANFGSASNLFVFPEYDLVPAQPLRTAPSSVNELISAGAAYVREFAACYERGTLIGACATIVNPTAQSTTSYTQSLALDANNLFDGGRIAWMNGVPAAIPANGAAILLRTNAAPQAARRLHR